MEVPAQAHRKVRRQRLVLEQRLQHHQRHTADQQPRQQEQAAPLVGPQPVRLNRPSQSTTRPSIANSKASKAPMIAVSSVIPAM